MVTEILDRDGSARQLNNFDLIGLIAPSQVVVSYMVSQLDLGGGIFVVVKPRRFDAAPI